MFAIYSHFAFNLYRLRESRGLSVAQVADFLGVEKAQYRQFELGDAVPSAKLVLELSSLLKIDPDRIKRWIEVGESKNKVQNISKDALRGADVYLGDFNSAVERIEKKYLESTGESLSPKQLGVIETLKKKLFGMLRLPLLPMNYILILHVLEGEEHRGRVYVHEIGNFLMDGETMAGFVAREPYLAAYIFYSANELYFQKDPCEGIIDCCNRLTLEQFENLLLLCVHGNPLYDEPKDLPDVQIESDFTSLAALMALKLKPHMPAEIKESFEHLYQACLFQGLGKYAIYYLMDPSAKIKEGKNEKDALIDTNGLNRPLFNLILYEMHGIAAAVICAHLKFPKQTLELLIRHHDQPVSAVDPLCAMLKLINLYVDNDFPDWTRQETEQTLQTYDQVKLKLEHLFKVSVELKKMKDELYARSSRLLEESGQIANFTKSKIRRIAKTAGPKLRPSRLPKGPDFRYDSGFQSTLLNVAYALHSGFYHRQFSRKIDESLDDFGERIKNISVNRDFLVSVDCELVAHKNQISEDELLDRLFKVK